MKNNFLFFFVMNCLFISCGKSKFYKEQKILSDFLETDSFLDDKKCLVLIPANGCGSCTQDIKEYLKLNYKNDKILFVISDYGKLNRLDFKDIQGFEEYVKIDKKSELISLGLVENKPIVCFIKNKQIEQIIKFDDSISDEVIQQIRDSIK